MNIIEHMACGLILHKVIHYSHVNVGVDVVVVSSRLR